ncbi:hypothetical protein ABVK25_008914 [Lepraria finkii]|uniref:Uncharacterized protein n=1 Tax=Lepraria finkii TaxID=1340010 RepID=A0ABR4B0B0_9LECA
MTPDKGARPPGRGVAVDICCTKKTGLPIMAVAIWAYIYCDNIVRPSTLRGLILFGGLGAKRLRNARLRLAQIDVAIFIDDNSCFDEMMVRYKKLRGYMR